MVIILKEQKIGRRTGLFFIKKILLLFIAFSLFIDAREGDDEGNLVKIGNLAVSGTTQPVGLLAIGQNVIDPCSALALFDSTTTSSRHRTIAEVAPEIIYGMREDLSILVTFPTAIALKEDGYRSSGSLDTIIQFEYVPYANHKPTFNNQFSLIASVILPTGNECKVPSTGLGSPSFLFGFTAVHSATEWYTYTSYGALITRKLDGKKIGNQFLYQAGFGKNIAYSPNKWTFLWIFEFSGRYGQSLQVDDVTVPHSRSNTLTFGPSLWFSTNKFLIQAGVVPVVQQRNSDDQPKSSFLASISVGCRFN